MDGSDHLQDDLAPIHMAQGSLNSLMRIKIMQIICYSFLSQQISTQLNSYGGLWLKLWVTTIIILPITFWKNSAHCSSTVPETYTSALLNSRL